MFPATAFPSGISCAPTCSFLDEPNSTHTSPLSGAWQHLCRLASNPSDIPSSHTYPCSLGPFRPRLTWSLFCNPFVFPASFFCYGTVCLSFSCTPMAASGSCENFGHWFATASYLSFIFYKRNCHLFCRCLFFSMFSGNRLQLAAHFPVLVASLSLYFSGMFLGDFCASLVVSFCHYFLLFKFE